MDNAIPRRVFFAPRNLQSKAVRFLASLGMTSFYEAGA